MIRLVIQGWFFEAELVPDGVRVGVGKIMYSGK